MPLLLALLQLATVPTAPISFDLAPGQSRPAVPMDDEDARYRIVVAREAGDDVKNAALDQSWRRCGVTGMPVCPSDGRTVARAGF